MNRLSTEKKSLTSATTFARPPAAAVAGDILIVEDDVELAAQTSRVLQDAGFATRHADSVAAARRELDTKAPDLVVLDRMLPDGDGLAYLEWLKRRGVECPSLVLSALGETSQRVQGLNVGADDYLAKPFDFAELVARVSALLRRVSSHSSEGRYIVGDLHLDLLARTATRSGVVLHLQPKEFALLAYLAENAGSIVTKEMLLKHVWNLNFDPQTNVVEAHVSRLRAKVDREFESSLVHTVRGQGYCLKPGGAQ